MNIKKTAVKSLLKRMVIAIFLVVMIPTTVIAIFATRISSEALQNQMKKSKETLALQTSNFVEEQMKHISDKFFQITISTSYREALQLINEKPPSNPVELARWNLDKINAIGTLTRDVQSAAVSDKYIASMSIIFKDGTITGTVLKAAHSDESLLQTSAYNSLKGNESLTWIESSEIDLSVMKEGLMAGMDLNGYGDVILMELNYSAFQDALKKIDIGETDYSYLIAPSGAVITSEDYDAEKNAALVQSELVRRIKAETVEKNAGSLVLDLEGVRTIVNYIKSNDSGFIYILAISEDEVLALSKNIRNTTMMLGAIFSVLSVLGGVVFIMGITKALNKVMGGMSKAEKGDLTSSIEIKRQDEFGQLARMYNSMVSSIKGMIRNSIEVSHQIHTSAETLATISNDSSKASSEIADAISDVAVGAEKQNGLVVESSHTVDSLAGRIEEVVKSTAAMEDSAGFVKGYTKEGITLAENLNEKAMEVKTITNDVVVLINDLSNSITNINKINGILNEISDMTKLLSLNASIEAARAGESGRGFMVVAEEIGKLAEQSYKHTSEIESLVSTLLEKTEHTSKFVKNADEVIVDQTNLVKESVDYFNKIDYATDELGKNISEIARSIHIIDSDKEHMIDSIKNIAEISEMAAASSEQVSASTQQQLSSIQELNVMASQLNAYAENLEASLKKFIV